jgi:hypothetical protein
VPLRWDATCFFYFNRGPEFDLYLGHAMLKPLERVCHLFGSHKAREIIVCMQMIFGFFFNFFLNLWINKKSQFSIHKFYLKYAIKVHVTMSQKKYQDY